MAVTYTAELAARATTYLALPTNSKRQPAGLEELAAIWAAIQGQPASSCRQCQFSDYQRDVAAYVREFNRLQNLTTMSDTTTAPKYQIAPAFAGETFVHEDLSAPVTAETLTDETAEFLISKGYDKQFVKVGSKDAEAAVAEAEQEPGDTRDYAEELAAEQEAHAGTQGSLEAEQANHAVAKSELEREAAAHAKIAHDLKELRATHKTDVTALKVEKEAHEATAKERDELNEQVTELTQKLAEATAKKASK